VFTLYTEYYTTGVFTLYTEYYTTGVFTFYPEYYTTGVFTLKNLSLKGLSHCISCKILEK